MTGRTGRQRGFALLIVLWTLAILALFGTHMLETARLDTQRARNLLDAVELETATNGAVQQAIYSVLDSSGQHWNADNTAHIVDVGGTLVVVRVESESDKVNPNVASVGLLQALLMQVGTDPTTAATVAGSIAEWRGGVQGRARAASARYVAAGLDYAPAGEEFTHLDELGAVLGMTPDLLARLRPHLTLFTDANPSTITADPVVAQALAKAGQVADAAGAGDADIVSLTADTYGPGPVRFGVHAVVRINARVAGRRYDVLAYERQQ